MTATNGACASWRVIFSKTRFATLAEALRSLRGANGRLCEIVVDDDGDGIPAGDRERIFQRFYRRSNDGTGTGLGLAIVRWIARAHDGTVTAVEAPSGGARFVAAIPSHKE